MSYNRHVRYFLLCCVLSLVSFLTKLSHVPKKATKRMEKKVKLKTKTSAFV